MPHDPARETGRSPPARVRRSPAYPAPVERLIAELTRLPGVGRRSAERMVFHILKGSPEQAQTLARAVAEVKRATGHCRVCANLTDTDPCAICADGQRDRTRVLVVEQPRDLIAIEQAGAYRGLYHVLLGALSPLDGVGPDDLTLAELLRRVSDPAANAGAVPVAEVILGMNPTLEGDGTALLLIDRLAPTGVTLTRLARGLPSGWSMPQAGKAVLMDAVEGRRPVTGRDAT